MGGAFALVAAWCVGLCIQGVAGAGTAGERLLIVSAAGPSYRAVGHVYDGSGRLVQTIEAPLHASLTWSPNGAMIAITDSAGVWVERANGSNKRQLLATKTKCTISCLSSPTVAWTPDGKQLAVGGVDPKTTGFALVDVASGRVTPLRAPKPFVFYRPIAFSPNGRWLAESFSSGDSGTASCCVEALVVAHADGSHPRVLHRFGDPIHDGPGVATWSPDSTRIAFTDDGRDSRDPRFAVVDVQSGRLHPLDPYKVYDQSPAWSPDGTRLALTQYVGPAFTVAADGTDFHSLGVQGTLAIWLRDGDVLIAAGDTGHTIVDIPGGQGETPRTLITLPGREQMLSMREAS